MPALSEETVATEVPSHVLMVTGGNVRRSAWAVFKEWIAASLALTGTPTAPTADPLTNNYQLATTEYADAADVATLTIVDEALQDYALKMPHINTQVDSYTLVTTDLNKVVTMNKATAVNLTVPPDSAGFLARSQVVVVQLGAGQVTFVPGSGVTLHSYDGNLKLAGQYAGATLVNVATDTWVIMGNLTA